MIEIYVDCRKALTTEQAAELGPWKNAAVLRSWIARNGVEPAAELNARTKLYYPADLGLEES
jgi:hypothetical protein